MKADGVQQEDVLRARISETSDNLSGLSQQLDSVNGELERLDRHRVRYEQLEIVCRSLDRLHELGGSDLFWGDGSSTQQHENIARARGKIGTFVAILSEIEDRRLAVVEQMEEGYGVLSILEDDLHDLELLEQERQAEWVPEREDVDIRQRLMVMPWSRGGDDDSRLRKALSTSLAIALLVGVLLPLVDLPLPDFETIPEMPDRFARLIQEELPPPPPPPPEPEVLVEEPPPEEQLEPVVAEETPPEVTEPVATEEPVTEEPPRPAGILAFRESLANLASAREPENLGLRARINDAGSTEIGRTERSMITTLGPGTSGGINLASLSRDVSGGGGSGIDGVEVGRVASSIGPAGNSDRPLASGAVAGRTDEEIQIVFDRYKAALYRLYNRELRNDPTLRGQVVLQLTIEPDGSVSACTIKSSELGAPALEQQIVERVLTFDFGAKDVAALTILYPIDFLPAA